MVKVNILCDYFGDSGYATHAKNLAKAMIDEGVEVAISTNKPNGWHTIVTDKELAALKADATNADYILIVGLPTIAPFFFGTNKPILQYAIWEGDSIPISWVPILSNEAIKAIIVPSTYNAQAITNTNAQLSKKIVVAPHGVSSQFKEVDREKNKEFTFLIDKGWPHGSRDRGGTSFAIKAYLEEFKMTDKVKMVVKVNPAYGFDQNTYARNTQEMGQYAANSASIKLIVQSIPIEELVKLYQEADAFVLPSLSEAFHLGGLQALACGVPLISTDSGGQTEYANDKNSWMVTDGKLMKVTWDVSYEDTNWKVPSIKALREAMRKAYNSWNTSVYSDKKKEAVETAKQFTWSSTAKKIISLIN